MSNPNVKLDPPAMCENCEHSKFGENGLYLYCTFWHKDKRCDDICECYKFKKPIKETK